MQRNNVSGTTVQLPDESSTRLHNKIIILYNVARFNQGHWAGKPDLN